MAYLVKPFQKSDLVPAIEIALSRFAEMQALEAEVATLSDRLETRKLVEAGQRHVDDGVQHDRARRVQVDTAGRHGQPDDHEAGRREDHLGEPDDRGPERRELVVTRPD
jgi:hypothetical protein